LRKPDERVGIVDWRLQIDDSRIGDSGIGDSGFGDSRIGYRGLRIASGLGIGDRIGNQLTVDNRHRHMNSTNDSPIANSPSAIPESTLCSRQSAIGNLQ
jgi:hypothetical protein